MNDFFKEYRKQNGVVPYLDSINYPDEYEEENIPQPVFSKWSINNKSAGNVDKLSIAGNVIKAVGHGMFAIISIGTGTGGVGAGISGAINETGKAVGTVNNSNMAAIGMSANSFIDYEKNYWSLYYRLMTFEPAEGNLGEEHIGKKNGDFSLGHWFYENGDYFEGTLFADGQRAGIFIFADGSRYFGNIDHGLKIGQGIEIAPDGSRTFGLFENGALSFGVFQCDQCAMIGEWSNGKLHGKGYARYSDNSAFVGDWSHGKPVQ